ncbi:MAG: DMT family transporter [Candidatus Hodarchaeales archaeon]|jgi:drug/metabolite transporter (DMT)-like permease
MFKEFPSLGYLGAVTQALFVTVLWSSSWVIIKFGLHEIPPLMFSGFRYAFASIVLLVMIFTKKSHRDYITTISSKEWSLIATYGALFIFITQGAMFIALAILPAITVSMVLNLTTFIVLLLSITLLKEIPPKIQWLYMLVGMFGIFIYFYPVNIPFNEIIGLIILGFGVFANALSSILGRAINRAKTAPPPLIVTGFSMLIGSTLLLSFGIILEGVPYLSILSLFYIAWLSIVNTAFAFTLWNKTLQTLRAVDSSLINSTMLPQTVVLAMLFLGEKPELLDWIGLIILVLSIILVQLNQAGRVNNEIKHKRIIIQQEECRDP